MILGLSRPGLAAGYCLAFLAAGFVWAAIAANVSALRDAPAIPYLARNWAVALPVLTMWVVLGRMFARRYLSATGGGAAEGLRLGVVFASGAFLFDAIVVAGLVGQGWRHFAQPILWVAYALLVLIPWLAGRSRRTA